YEPLCLADAADLVVVVGDVNSTMACALTAKKCHLTVAHLESGLRSGDRTMPEEINRIVTDAIADCLWTDTQEADDTLLSEGHTLAQISRVGNIMIDAFELAREKIAANDKPMALNLSGKTFAVTTLHRPANVDEPRALAALVEALLSCAASIPIVF